MTAPKKSNIALLVLLALVLAARHVPGLGELYALHVYPYISVGLSWLTSFVPWSVQEWVAVAAVVLLVAMPIVSLARNKKKWRIVKNEAVAIGWLYVWFYLGWGCNYYRHDLLTRIGAEPAKPDKREFQAFIKEYTDSLNSAECRVQSAESSVVQSAECRVQSASAQPNSALCTLHSALTLNSALQQVYSAVPARYGLTKPRSFQKPKRVVFNSLYSGVGVLGYMGPCTAESQLNAELLPHQYPFTLAHEMSHLLGVSSEAEANFWAFVVCRQVPDASVRYSAYLGVLPHIIFNSRMIQTAEEHDRWLATVSKRALADLRRESSYWQERRSPLIDSIQTTIYNWFLKSNNIPSGIHNYSEVVSLLMATKGEIEG